jgi:peptidoglycan hydrolase FlgJ
MDISTLPRTVKAADLPLERLATNDAISQPDKVKEVSRQFEAVLLRQILNEAYKTSFASATNPPSVAHDIYQDIITNQLAENISKSGGFGLARSFQHQLTQQTAVTHPGDDAGKPATPHSFASKP